MTERSRYPCVLVVDDQADIRQALEYLLGEEGFEVLTAENGAEALATLSERPVDLILLDQMMPVMDGREFVAALRARPPLAAIPVIVLSAVPMLQPDALPPVFGGFFTKPFDIDALVRAVRYWVRSTGLAALIGASLRIASAKTTHQVGVDQWPASEVLDERAQPIHASVPANLLDRLRRDHEAAA